MPTDRRLDMFDDPLRDARLAVADERFDEALNLIAALPSPTRQAPDARLLEAMADWRTGAFTRSRAAALEARDGFRQRGDSDGEMRAENVAAAGAFALGHLEEAERGFTRAMELAERLANDLMVARCAVNLGNIAYYRDQAEYAMSFYRIAVAQFERLSFLSGLAEGWLNSAIVLHDAGRIDDSLDASERAVSAAVRSGNERLLGQALAARSETDIATGDLDLGFTLAERALALARSHRHAMGEADALRVLSVVARLRGHADRALDCARSAVAIATEVADPWRIAEAERELGTVYASIGRADDARGAFSAAAEAFSQLGAEGRAKQMRARAEEVGAA